LTGKKALRLICPNVLVDPIQPLNQVGSGTGEPVGAPSVSHAARVMIADTDHSHNTIS
jgi:hypothetical protein